MTAPTTDEITATVAAVVADALGVTAVEPDADLRAVDGVSSVVVLRMLGRIEDRYGIDLPDEDVFAATTVRRIADVVAGAIRA